ncbi:hypothetical protein EVAR_10623_1 [Eumeta japonica]|uniref:Uncharacterized protein n=1 Tax=Eumeta variegata TaxID=151549 RepID=A0A4C1U279_EUMVA|nr:hypothetical protein EVAR_10623_1 [Eumeta japonica]
MTDTVRGGRAVTCDAHGKKFPSLRLQSGSNPVLSRSKLMLLRTELRAELRAQTVKALAFGEIENIPNV